MSAADIRGVMAAFGLLLLICGCTASNSRTLLQCIGGCQVWGRGSAGRQICAGCCSGLILQNGACVAGTANGHLQVPYTTTTPFRATAYPRFGGAAATTTATGTVTGAGAITLPSAAATSTATRTTTVDGAGVISPPAAAATATRATTVDGARAINPAGATATSTTTRTVDGTRGSYPNGATATTTATRTGSVTGARGVIYPTGATGTATTTGTVSREVNPAGPRGPSTATATRTTTTDVQRRGLLAGCSGGCASWRSLSGGRRTCATCCSRFVMQNGGCVAKNTAVQRGPYGSTATRTTGSAVRLGGR